MKLFKKKGNNKGFSLVELIVVVAIMAVLLGVLVPTLIRHVESSKLGKDKQAIDNVKEAIEIALANEKYMAFDVDANLYNGGKIDLDNLTAGITAPGASDADKAAFVQEVKDNIGGKDTITLTSKLAATGTSITVKVEDCVCTIVVDAAKNGDYDFVIGETNAAPVTPTPTATAGSEG